MIYGTFHVGRVVEESRCRTSKNYRFTDVGMYAIHANTLMANIPFGPAAVTTKTVDSSIFANDKDTQLKINHTIKCQNFLTTRYTGEVPLEWYNNNQWTLMGREFTLICRHGYTHSKYRTFRSLSNLEGYDAYNNTTYPGGGEYYVGGESTPGATIDPYVSIGGGSDKAATMMVM